MQVGVGLVGDGFVADVHAHRLGPNAAQVCRVDHSQAVLLGSLRQSRSYSSGLDFSACSAVLVRT
jgi:hypothetical protein